MVIQHPVHLLSNLAQNLVGLLLQTIMLVLVQNKQSIHFWKLTWNLKICLGNGETSTYHQIFEFNVRTATERRPKCQVAVPTNHAHRYVCMVCLPTFIIHLPYKSTKCRCIYIYVPYMDPMGLLISFMPLNFFHSMISFPCGYYIGNHSNSSLFPLKRDRIQWTFHISFIFRPSLLLTNKYVSFQGVYGK